MSDKKTAVGSGSDDLVRKLTSALVITSIAAVVAIAAAVMAGRMAASKKQAVIGVDAQARILPAIPLSNPVLPDVRVVGFAEECVRKALSHDFKHFETTLPQAADCFTPDAADKFSTGVQGLINTMKTKRMVMSSSFTKPMRVVRFYQADSQFGMSYHWDLEAEIEISMEGAKERIPAQRQKLSVTVTRVPLEWSPRGVLLEKFFTDLASPT